MLTLFTGTQVRDDELLIQGIAKDVARVTLGQLKPTASHMNVAELRGYLRTRAAAEARTQVRRSIVELHLQQEREAELTAAVLERAIHLVIRDLFVQPVVSIPAPHVRLRIAA
jgi:hypothetical protein